MVERRINEREAIDIGDKQGTVYRHGCCSIKFYEEGIEIKPFKQPRVVLNWQARDFLLAHLKVWEKRQKLLEEI